MANQLHWFPLDPEKHLTRTARLGPEARAAYDWLRCYAWLAGNRGEPPCSLPDDDAELALLSGLGQRWAKVAAKVRSMFDASSGRLVDQDLLATWEDQLTKYERRAAAGGKGGNAKAKKKQSPSNASLTRKQPELEPEGTVQTLTESVPVPAPVGALGVEPPRLPGANGGPPTALADIIPAAVFDRFGADWRAAMAGEPH